MADLSARRQGKSLLRISRRTRTCRPASRGNAWALPARGLTSPCLPLRGDLRSRSAHTQPPARPGGPSPCHRRAWGVRESGAGCGRPEDFRGAMTSLQVAFWLRAARNDAVLSHLANARVFSMASRAAHQATLGNVTGADHRPEKGRRILWPASTLAPPPPAHSARQSS